MPFARKKRRTGVRRNLLTEVTATRLTRRGGSGWQAQSTGTGEVGDALMCVAPATGVSPLRRSLCNECPAGWLVGGGDQGRVAMRRVRKFTKWGGIEKRERASNECGKIASRCGTAGCAGASKCEDCGINQLMDVSIFTAFLAGLVFFPLAVRVAASSRIHLDAFRNRRGATQGRQGAARGAADFGDRVCVRIFGGVHHVWRVGQRGGRIFLPGTWRHSRRSQERSLFFLGCTLRGCSRKLL